MKRKITLSLFALFLCFTIGILASVLYMSSSISELKNIIKLQEVEQLRRSLIIKTQTVQSELYDVNTVFANDIDLIVREGRDLNETAGKCTSCHHAPKLLNRIVRVQDLILEYKKSLSYYITASANTNMIAELKSDAILKGKKLIALTEEMSHSASTSLEQLTNNAMTRLNHVMIMLLITAIVTFLFGIVVAYNLIASVTKPVKELVHATHEIASGNLGSKISYTDDTEFGELAKNFNIMSSAIHRGYEDIRKEVNERKHAEEALRESEETLKSVFNQMQDFFFRTDIKGRIIWFSPSAISMLRLASSEGFIGRNFTEFFASSEKRQLFLEELFDRGKMSNYEAELRCGDGMTVVVNIDAHLYLDNPGNVAGVQGVCRDITDLKKIEEEHLKMEKLESVGIMAGGIAHDFNNILTTIAGNIALARMSEDSGKGLGKILTEAERACEHAKNLTIQLLTFSKGGSPIKRTQHINALLEDSARFALQGTNVKCSFTLSPDLWPAEIDEGQITQVVHNLVLNANQALPEGGTIKIGAENITLNESNPLPLRGKEYIKISVIDHGMGIPKEYLNKIFDPYFTTKQSGSGLGLASTYSIIKNHGGHIYVFSEVGRGAEFHVYLPSSKDAAVSETKKAGKIMKGEGRILVMDDEPSVRDTIRKILMYLGFDVEIVKNGDEAIASYKKAGNSGHTFDAVIMDLTIRGGLGGEETMKQLRDIDPDIKAIVSSGYSKDPIMANFRHYGFSGVIVKPYDIEQLSELLNRLIHK